MLTIRPAPRWPILGIRLFSMIRTGMSFLSKARASMSPEGPAPTYAMKHRKLLAIDQGNNAQLELGEVLLEKTLALWKLLWDFEDDAFKFWGVESIYICNTRPKVAPVFQ